MGELAYGISRYSAERVSDHIAELRDESYEAPGSALKLVRNVDPYKIIEAVIRERNAGEEHEAEDADHIRILCGGEHCHAYS